jgi:hypothetical protein
MNRSRQASAPLIIHAKADVASGALALKKTMMHHVTQIMSSTS